MYLQVYIVNCVFMCIYIYMYVYVNLYLHVYVYRYINICIIGRNRFGDKQLFSTLGSAWVCLPHFTMPRGVL